jgi:hypothetical protein
MAHLDVIADRQAEWSATANSLKSVIDRARRAVFVLSVLGALLAAVASQMGSTDPSAPESNARTWVAIAAAISLAVATFFSQRLLGAEHTNAWVRARAVSEALKREAYKFAAGAAPYDGADRDAAAALLDQERGRIEADGDDLLGLQVRATGPGSTPRAPLTPDEYVAQRVDGQIRWYRDKADQYSRAARNLRWTEFGLALAATLITALASVVGKSIPLFGMTWDIAALTAVLTTIAGAVLAHVEASRYDHLVMTYRAASRRLQDRKGSARPSWSGFVNDCESILSTENASWIAKWTRAGP